MKCSYQLTIPDQLQDLKGLRFEKGRDKAVCDPKIQALFPHLAKLSPYHLISKHNVAALPRIGVVFSGGPAPGGHNVIAGLSHASSHLFGFLNGPAGCIQGNVRELSREEVSAYLNQGGFDLLGTGRTKIETQEQMASVLKVCENLKLHGLVIIGGDDSNTNAAFLAEYFLAQGSSICVVGVPKTIDGDLQSKEITIPFGFDTACKTYSEIIGNICRDAVSTKKYYHFIKLMGRSASHIPLECALQTHPNLTLIGEEKRSLDDIVDDIVDLIEKRDQAQKNYGVIVFPEGIIEWMPEMKSLIEALNAERKLNSDEEKLFKSLPETTRSALSEKDPHGNLSLSSIPTEELLIHLVKQKINRPLACQGHFLGYEGRCAFPSHFDAHYTYALGLTAALAIQSGATGVIAAITHLKENTASWKSALVPLLTLLHLETRNGKLKPVIQKTFVDLSGKPFKTFAREQTSWRTSDSYQYPGPIQLFGPPEVVDGRVLTLEV
jgi:pyrophosphate--fructose-6-phosphate 1-phosphotransferase